ncbi:MAG TPA: glycosyltransferase family 4 protein [Acidimicrobiales bacterium]
MSRPRVAYVAHSIDPRRGGMELVSARLLERLAQFVDLEVVAGDGLETLPDGIRRSRVPIPTRPSIARLLAFDAIASIRLRAVRRRCDLVHTCGAVAHARADLVTMHLSHAEVVAAQGGLRPPGRRGVAGAVASLRRRLALALERWALASGRTRLVAAVSSADERALAARYPETPTTLIENGFDAERFEFVDRRERDATSPLQVIVLAGDFERKGVPLAIQGVAATSRCTLRVLGAGDLDAMRLLAHRLGAEGRVVLAGHVPDVASELDGADVVLSCSAHESFGLSMVEGAATGCAVVCTDTGVGPELCEDAGDGPGGIVVAGQVSAIAAALERLDGDRAVCRAMGTVAAAAARRFSWDHMVEQTLAAYEQLLGGSR